MTSLTLSGRVPEEIPGNGEGVETKGQAKAGIEEVVRSGPGAALQIGSKGLQAALVRRLVVHCKGIESRTTSCVFSRAMK